MSFVDLVIELFTKADHFLVTIATEYGMFVYAAMFMIFFLETGIVIMAFLPGDSLLFVAGTVAAAGTMNPWALMLSVILGACAGKTLGFPPLGTGNGCARPGRLYRQQHFAAPRVFVFCALLHP